MEKVIDKLTMLSESMPLLSTFGAGKATTLTSLTRLSLELSLEHLLK